MLVFYTKIYFFKCKYIFIYIFTEKKYQTSLFEKSHCGESSFLFFLCRFLFT